VTEKDTKLAEQIERAFASPDCTPRVWS
jgi:hypothetical protein